MTRIQILLSDGQNEKLSHLAKRLKTTKSRIIRDAVDKMLREKIPEKSDPLMELIGQAGEAGRPDISTRHDQYMGQKEKVKWARERSS